MKLQELPSRTICSVPLFWRGQLEQIASRKASLSREEAIRILVESRAALENYLETYTSMEGLFRRALEIVPSAQP